jgi:hypothetical protein
MVEVRDCKGRLACVANEISGVVESVYKGHKTKVRLALGEVFTVEREGIVTSVTRVNQSAFAVESNYVT